MASDENQQLSSEDLREIEECEKIVKFWEEVMGGRHHQIKIPPHLLSQLEHPPAQEAALVPLSHDSDKIVVLFCGVEIEIDLCVDYYKSLGVEPHVSLDSITRAFESKWTPYSPCSKAGKRKWLSSVNDVRHEVQDKWARVSKARQILTNPELREIYDAGRAKPLSISTSASDITPRRLEEYFLTDEQKGVLERKMKREVEMGERKNSRGEREEGWERGERLGGMESDADDGDSTKVVYHSQKNVMAYTRFRTEVSRQRDREWMMGRVGSAEMRKRTPTARVLLPK